jgi:hypothetical protein
MIRMPRLLHELHGERTTVGALVFTYVAVVVAGLSVGFLAALRPADPVWWKRVLAAILAADLAGGVVANFTAGTDEYYAARPRTRVIFIALHVVQPALLWLCYRGAVWEWGAVAGFTLVSAAAVNAVRGRAIAEPVAALLVVTGVGASVALGLLPVQAAWFTPIFLMKLVLAFAVRRSEGAVSSPEKSGHDGTVQ